MPLVTITIDGAEEASLVWDNKDRTLDQSNHKWSGGVMAAVGGHTYRIAVGGQPGDRWTSVVSEADAEGNNDTVTGVMSADGRDSTGTRPFNVK